jgi:site-specific DNA-methyltransferase (adenine-specific)
MGRLQAHKFAELVPAMSEAEYHSLKASVINAGKFTDDGWLYQGKILDGRHRERVARETGIKLTWREFKGSDAEAIQFVYSKANHRNMTDSQKAAAAVNFLPYFEADARKRQSAAGGNKRARGTDSASAIPVSDDGCVEGLTLEQWRHSLPDASREDVHAYYKTYVDPEARDNGGRSFALMVKRIVEALSEAIAAAAEKGTARDFAGALFGVSGRYVADAKLIRERDPKLFQEVFEGRTVITKAKRQITRHAKRRDLLKKAKAAPAVRDCDIRTGDCIAGMEVVPSKSVRLIFADPPYNIGIDYGGGAKKDQVAEDVYYAWSARWLAECARVLTADGTLFVMNAAQHLADFEMILRGAVDMAFELHRRNVIIWHETFGNHTSGNFTDCWRPILYYTRSPDDFVWHGDEIVIPSDRQTKYNDARADEAGKVPTNVWQFPRVADNHPQRVPGFPTQLPLELVERIVKVASDPGDTVLDPFTGSGTTAVAACLNGRKFIGFEKSKKFAEMARLRVRAAAAERKG